MVALSLNLASSSSVQEAVASTVIVVIPAQVLKSAKQYCLLQSMQVWLVGSRQLKAQLFLVQTPSSPKHLAHPADNPALVTMQLAMQVEGSLERTHENPQVSAVASMVVALATRVASAASVHAPVAIAFKVGVAPVQVSKAGSH